MARSGNEIKRICLNQSVLEFMDSKINPRSTVIEFGAGYSSPWFAQRCGRFISFETSLQWARLASAELNDLAMNNWQIKFVPSRVLGFTRDVDSTLNSQSFTADLILVDCRENLREAATMIGWQYLNPGGIMVFDDAQRTQHKTAIDWVANKSIGKAKFLRWQEGDIESARERVAIAFQKL